MVTRDPRASCGGADAAARRVLTASAVVLCMFALAGCDAEPSAEPVDVVDPVPQTAERVEPSEPPAPHRPEIVLFTLRDGVVLDRSGADVYGVRLRRTTLASRWSPDRVVGTVLDRIPFLSSSAVLQRIVLTESLRSEGRPQRSVSDPESGTVFLGGFIDVMCPEILCGELSVMLRAKFPDRLPRAAWPSQWDAPRASASAERYDGGVGAVGIAPEDSAFRRRGFVSREASMSFEADFDSVVAGILAEPGRLAAACAESPTIERKRVLALEFLTACGYRR